MGREAGAASAVCLASAGRLLGCREDWYGGEGRRRVSKEGGELWGRAGRREEDWDLIRQVR